MPSIGQRFLYTYDNGNGLLANVNVIYDGQAFGGLGHRFIPENPNDKRALVIYNLDLYIETGRLKPYEA